MSDGPAWYIYEDDAGKWRWTFVAANGEIMADSGQGYGTHGGCVSAAHRIQELMSVPDVHMHDPERPPGG
jgi:uncharacterized protein YegP (UPF0339 family)